MKGFALILLCALVAVQARHTSLVKSDDTEVSQQSPWTVHLRIAVSTSGLLETCTGTLIHEFWGLTTASCLSDTRFIWARFGLVQNDVITPSLVYELGVANANGHSDYNVQTGENNIALLNIPRGALVADSIAAVALALPGSEVPSTSVYCAFGSNGDAPGDILSCSAVSVEKVDDATLSTSAESVSKFDLGAGLVSDNVVYGFLSSADGTFTSTAAYLDWIEATSGVSFSPENGDSDDSDDSDDNDDNDDNDDSDDSDSNDDSDDSDVTDAYRINFVN